MIRQATRYDIPRLLELIEQYAIETGINALANKANHDAKYVEQFLFEIISGRGFVLIDNNLRGCLIGLVNKNVWCPAVTELHELLWWVEPEFRNTMVGGKLWLEFDKIATSLLKEGKIQMVCTSVSPKGPLIDYTKRGYKVMQATFVRD